MLVTRRNGRFACVNQYDHGALAGELAARWGNERFAPVAMDGALRIAAAHHDDGWRELDDLPAYNAEAGRVAHFLELPLERTAPPYGRNVDSVYERDALAGALVAMHWTGLYSARWGLQSTDGPQDKPLARRVVEEQEARRERVLREVWDFRGPRGEFDLAFWHAYAVLQALDVTSLALSLLDPAAPTEPGAEPVGLPASLIQVDQPPGGRVLPAVPTGTPGEYVEQTLTVAAPGVAVIDPWPYSVPSFETELAVRTLPAEPLSEAEGAAALHAAPVETIAWKLAADPQAA